MKSASVIDWDSNDEMERDMGWTAAICLHRKSKSFVWFAQETTTFLDLPSAPDKKELYQPEESVL